MELSSEDVQDILQLLDGLPFGELHLRTTRFSLWLRRTAEGEWTQELQVQSEPTVSPGAVPAEPVPAEPVPAGPGPAEPAPAAGGGAERDAMRAVRAPLPGTFYRAPRPGAAPFVEVGSAVEPDTVVGIVETMKLMNSVSAGVRGTVAQIAVANGQLAEQDTVLAWIREDR